MPQTVSDRRINTFMGDNAEWMDDAACKGETDLFFGNGLERGGRRHNTVAKAKAICAECPVIDPCREHAVRYESYGIWGGMSQRQLKAERRRRGISLWDAYQGPNVPERD